MTREERLAFCRICTNRKFDMRVGLTCSLTGKVADFEEDCPAYCNDGGCVRPVIAKIEEKGVAAKGRRKALSVFYMLIGLSISAIVLSHLAAKQINEQDVVIHILRFVVEISLYYAIYSGKNWARRIVTVLCALGILISIFAMIKILSGSIIFGLLMMVPIFIFVFAIYCFYGDSDFKAFFEHQKGNA